MIKWWLSSSVTFPCRCYCLSWRFMVSGSGYCLTGLWHKAQNFSYRVSADTQSADLSHFYLRPRRVGERLWEGGDSSAGRHAWLWGDIILGSDLFVCFWFVCLFLNIAGTRGWPKTTKIKKSDLEILHGGWPQICLFLLCWRRNIST